MHKPIIIALLIVLLLTLVVWAFSYFIQPILPPEVNNIFYLFGLALIATITLLADIPDIVDRLSVKKKAELDEQQKQRNRRNMLQLVWNNWIEGVLKKSLYNEVLIELGMETKPDAVEHPWDMVMLMPGQEPKTVAKGTTILELFDQSCGSLLILGEPGSGKTTMLLEAARKTIERAQQDQMQPVLVVFNLSSWTPGHTIATWLVDELRSRYSVSPRIGLSWIENDDLLLLLDSLDEVNADSREACIQAINTFRDEHDASLVICSRMQEYQSSVTRLNLQRAVMIQPMDDRQVNKYLREVGHKFAAPYKSLIHRAEHMDCNEEEREFLHTPLFLSILVLAFQKKSSEELKTLITTDNYREQLFDTYISQMFKRRRENDRFAFDEVVKWLACLASGMVNHKQSLFYIEDIQPSWLPYSKKKCGLIGGLIIGLVLGLVLGPDVWLIAGLSSGLSSGLSAWLGSGLIAWLGIVLISVVIGMLIGGLGFGFGEDSKPTEKMSFSWSWKKARKKLIVGLIVGLIFGLIAGLIVGLIVGLIFGLIAGLILGLFFGLIDGLILGLIDGLGSTAVEQRSVPGSGIRASRNNALIGGLIIGLISGLIVGMFFGLISGLFIGMSVGLFCAMLFGGEFLVTHLTSRYLLYRSGHIPWNLVDFLICCTDRIFIRRVGGGYIFIHRMLMEHFAAMDEEKIKTLTLITPTSYKKDKT